jgi:phosphatidylserine decarboxylase
VKLVPIAGDGWRFIIGFTALGAFLLWLGRWWSTPWGVLFIGLGVFSVFFFRDFDRNTPADENAIYSPGDGKVVDVSTVADGEYAGQAIIRIFLSVFDGHVQRMPANGRVRKIEYKKGLFLDARHERAHVDNEQNTVVLDTPKGTLIVKQIAGLIARRIVCWAKEGDSFVQGQRYGLIRFGSQVDVIMPAKVQTSVKPGDRVVSGISVLARWK